MKKSSPENNTLIQKQKKEKNQNLQRKSLKKSKNPSSSNRSSLTKKQAQKIKTNNHNKEEKEKLSTSQQEKCITYIDLEPTLLKQQSEQPKQSENSIKNKQTQQKRFRSLTNLIYNNNTNANNSILNIFKTRDKSENYRDKQQQQQVRQSQRYNDNFISRNQLSIGSGKEQLKRLNNLLSQNINNNNNFSSDSNLIINSLQSQQLQLQKLKSNQSNNTEQSHYQNQQQYIINSDVTFNDNNYQYTDTNNDNNYDTGTNYFSEVINQNQDSQNLGEVEEFGKIDNIDLKYTESLNIEEDISTQVVVKNDNKEKSQNNNQQQQNKHILNSNENLIESITPNESNLQDLSYSKKRQKSYSNEHENLINIIELQQDIQQQVDNQLDPLSVQNTQKTQENNNNNLQNQDDSYQDEQINLEEYLPDQKFTLLQEKKNSSEYDYSSQQKNTEKQTNKEKNKNDEDKNSNNSNSDEDMFDLDEIQHKIKELQQKNSQNDTNMGNVILQFKQNMDKSILEEQNKLLQQHQRLMNSSNVLQHDQHQYKQDNFSDQQQLLQKTIDLQQFEHFSQQQYQSSNNSNFSNRKNNQSVQSARTKKRIFEDNPLQQKQYSNTTTKNNSYNNNNNNTNDSFTLFQNQQKQYQKQTQSNNNIFNNTFNSTLDTVQQLPNTIYFEKPNSKRSFSDVTMYNQYNNNNQQQYQQQQLQMAQTQSSQQFLFTQHFQSQQFNQQQQQQKQLQQNNNYNMQPQKLHKQQIFPQLQNQQIQQQQPNIQTFHNIQIQNQSLISTINGSCQSPNIKLQQQQQQQQQQQNNNQQQQFFNQSSSNQLIPNFNHTIDMSFYTDQSSDIYKHHQYQRNMAVNQSNFSRISQAQQIEFLLLQSEEISYLKKKQQQTDKLLKQLQQQIIDNSAQSSQQLQLNTLNNTIQQNQSDCILDNTSQNNNQNNNNSVESPSSNNQQTQLQQQNQSTPISNNSSNNQDASNKNNNNQENNPQQQPIKQLQQKQEQTPKKQEKQQQQSINSTIQNLSTQFATQQQQADNININNSNNNQQKQKFENKTFRKIYTLIKLTPEDIGIRLTPDYPGDRTGEVLEGGPIKLKCDKKVQKQVLLNSNKNQEYIQITFYHLYDQRGWIFDIYPQDKSVQFQELQNNELQQYENIPELNIQEKVYQLNDQGRNVESFEDAVKISDKMRTDYNNSLRFALVRQVSCSFIINNLSGKNVYPIVKKEDHGEFFTHPLMIPNNYFGVFLHTKQDYSIFGSSGIIQYSDQQFVQKNQLKKLQQNSSSRRKETIWEIEWQNSFSSKIQKQYLQSSTNVISSTLNTGDDRHTIYKITLNSV